MPDKTEAEKTSIKKWIPALVRKKKQKKENPRTKARAFR
jgi:hypothetical protein